MPFKDAAGVNIMICRSFSRHRQGQWTLIGLLATISIIAILAAIYIPNVAAKHSAPGEARTPRERAYGAACTEYEVQMNQAVTMYKMDNDDRPPSSLDDLKKYGVTNDMINAEGCSFIIDQRTGRITDIGQGRGAPPPPPSPGRVPTGFHPDDPTPANHDAGASRNSGYSGYNNPQSQGDPVNNGYQRQEAPQSQDARPTDDEGTGEAPQPAGRPGGQVGPGGIRLPNIPGSGM